MLGRSPDVRGDIPPAPHRTYRTSSVRSPALTMQYTCRQLTNSEISATPVTNSTAQYNFQLSNLDGVSNFSALFDQYMLQAVRVSIVPNNNAVGLVTNTTVNLVPLYCVLDYDDATAPTSIAQMREYDNCIICEPGESIIRTFSPRLAAAAYSGTFTSFMNLGPQWIDMASPSVAHYGMKIFIPGVATGQTILQTWDVQFEYFFSFRSLRG